ETARPMPVPAAKSEAPKPERPKPVARSPKPEKPEEDVALPFADPHPTDSFDIEKVFDVKQEPVDLPLHHDSEPVIQLRDEIPAPEPEIFKPAPEPPLPKLVVPPPAPVPIEAKVEPEPPKVEVPKPEAPKPEAPKSERPKPVRSSKAEKSESLSLKPEAR